MFVVDRGVTSEKDKGGGRGVMGTEVLDDLERGDRG